MDESLCLNNACRASLPEAGTEVRFCPCCGAVRAISDPLDRPSSAAILRVGQDSFGTQTGRFYAHSSLTAAPTRVEPFQNLPLGSRSLFPASGEFEALHTIDSAPPALVREKDFPSAVKAGLLRNGRFYLLFESGVLAAYGAHDLQAVPSFESCYLPDTLQPRNFHFSSNFLALLGENQGRWEVRTFDAATGEPEPEPLTLDLDNPQLVFEGTHGVALGYGPSDLRFHVWQLKATPHSTNITGRTSVKCRPRAENARPWWGTLEGHSFLLCPDGKLRRWEQDSGSYRALWNNEGLGRLTPPVKYKDELLFLVKGESFCRLLRLSSLGEIQEVEIPCREVEPNSTAAVHGDSLYFLSQKRPGFSLQSFHLTSGELSELQSLPGATDVSHVQMTFGAVQRRPYLLLWGRSATRWNFWGLDLVTRDLTTQLMGHPGSQESLRLLWEGSETWLLRLKDHTGKGRLQCLPVSS